MFRGHCWLPYPFRPKVTEVPGEGRCDDVPPIAVGVPSQLVGGCHPIYTLGPLGPRFPDRLYEP